MNAVASRFAVVIVSYETREYLERALDAWAQTPYTPLVVDNASSDGSAHAARSRGARALAFSENLGYGAAANAGIAATDGEFVLVSNPDAWPAETADVEALVRRIAEEPRLGAVGPRFRGLDGELQPTLLAQASRWWTGSHAVTSFPSQRAPIARPRPKFLTGAAILFRRAALDEVGAFDPSFFVHYGEVDLCRRLTAAGWQLGVASDSTFVHVGGVATRPRWDAAYRDLLRAHLRILERYEGREAADRARRWLATSVAVRARVGSQEQRAFLERHARWLRTSSLDDVLETDPAAQPVGAQPVHSP